MTDPKDARIKELEAEVERLKSETKFSEREVDYAFDQVELELSLREACAALEFYGRERNWTGNSVFLREHLDAAGDRARTTLASIKARHPNFVKGNNEPG